MPVPGEYNDRDYQSYEDDSLGNPARRVIVKNPSDAPIPVSPAKVSLTGSSSTFATVGTSSASVLAANASRKGCTFINTSTNTIYLSVGSTAVIGSGIALNASGGTWVMDDYTFSTQQIFGIASGASSNLAIHQFI